MSQNILSVDEQIDTWIQGHEDRQGDSSIPEQYGSISLCTKINSLPNDKIVDWSKMKAFADDKIHVTEKLKLVLERLENIVGKGENAGYHNVFKRLLRQGS